MNIFRKYFISKKRIQFQKKVDNHLDILTESLTKDIDDIANVVQLIKSKYNTDELPIVINHFLFFKVSFRDIISLTKQVADAKDKHEKNLLNRTLAQHLYEFLDDTKDFLGKNFKNDLEKLPNSILLVPELYRLKEYYKAIKNSMFSALGDIRHNTSAHKTQDGTVLNRMIKSIDSKEVNTNCILVWMLFALILNFQTNILRSIMHHEESKILKKTSEIEPFIIELGIDAEFKKDIMILQGVHPEFAKYICNLSKVQIEKLQRAVALLSKELDHKA